MAMTAFGRSVRNLSRAVVVTAAAAGAASAADSNLEVNPKPQLVGAVGVTVLDLNGGSPGTDAIVATAATGELSVFFNAECSVAAPDDTTFVAVEILVDGSFTALNGTDRAFCTSTGDSSLEHWVSAAANVVRAVGAGSHTIRVRARLVGGVRPDRGQIDDTTLVVIETP
jgi:hypothetical protein